MILDKRISGCRTLHWFIFGASGQNVDNDTNSPATTNAFSRG